MKKLVAAVVLTTAIASPALAQQMSRQAREPAPSQAFALATGQAFVQQNRLLNRRAHSSNPANDVYSIPGDPGAYVGSDPDPRIRSELRRDNPLLSE